MKKKLLLFIFLTIGLAIVYFYKINKSNKITTTTIVVDD